MSDVRFPEYLSYVSARQEANNAMMALLAGSRIAAHTLQLTEGSARPLADIFPAVAHIRRFNLVTESARALLVDADAHLGAVAVPYALALHEDFVMTCLSMIKSAGFVLKNGGQPLKAWNMHEVLYATLDLPTPSDDLALFHLLRLMRNCQIHSGGQVSMGLIKHINGLSEGAKELWEGLTGERPEGLAARTRLKFSAAHISTAFAVTKKDATAVNHLLKDRLPKEKWAEIAARDYTKQSLKLRNSDQWMRTFLGFARQRYPVGMSDQQLQVAAIKVGSWDRGIGVVPPRRRDRVRPQ